MNRFISRIGTESRTEKSFGIDFFRAACPAHEKSKTIFVIIYLFFIKWLNVPSSGVNRRVDHINYDYRVDFCKIHNRYSPFV